MLFDRFRVFKELADMPLEKRTTFVSSDTTLSLTDQVVEVDSSGGAVTITLPSAAEAAGVTFDISAPSGASNAVTVNDAGGSNVLDKGSTNTLDADGDFAVLVSNGRVWRHVDYTYD